MDCKIDYQFTVSADGGGDFRTISEAVAKIPRGASAELRIRNGVYREKLRIDAAREIRLIGEDREKTVVTWQDGAYDLFPDGRKCGTFRSYTLYLGGERALVKNLTVRNTAGPGDTAGQAVAVYADAGLARFENVSLLGRQDTLFLAPLPEKPRIPGSFVGPGETAPRAGRRDYFQNCYVEGDVDFIFGGAEAAFCGCTLFSRSRNRRINGFVTAASTPQKQKYGFLFDRCRLLSDCAPGTVYLGRPWREFAAVAFLRCHFGEQIAADGWQLWHPGSSEAETVRLAEYQNEGPGASGRRPGWVREMTEEEFSEFLREEENLSCLTAFQQG